MNFEREYLVRKMPKLTSKLAGCIIGAVTDGGITICSRACNVDTDDACAEAAGLAVC